MLADRWLGADLVDLCQLCCAEGSDWAVAYVGETHRGSCAAEHSRVAVGLAQARDSRQ